MLDLKDPKFTRKSTNYEDVVVKKTEVKEAINDIVECSVTETSDSAEDLDLDDGISVGGS